MQINNLIFANSQWEDVSTKFQDKDKADIVFLFGDTDTVNQEVNYIKLKTLYPNSHIVGCSSSGNILGVSISSHSIVASAVKFEHSKVEVASMDYTPGDDLEELAAKLVNKLTKENLKHIFVLSDGLNINGSELVRGINHSIDNVVVTGGMAGDGAKFEKTFVICDDLPKQNRIAIVGFYGEHLHISSGCFAGWSEFGAYRTITKSTANVLYEIDNEPALDFYKRYLGEYAKELPNSGLRFPLSIKQNSDDPEVIRTLLGIDEENKTITFAGDVPQGYMAKLMKPDMDALIDGAGVAANEIKQSNDKTALGLVVSCVGRKLVLGELIDDELEAMGDILGENVNLVGFYSYGEIAPFETDILKCQLHNQTMTLTTLYED